MVSWVYIPPEAALRTHKESQSLLLITKNLEILICLCYHAKCAFKDQFSSVAQLCLTLCNPLNTACQASSLSVTNSRSSLRPTSIESVMPSSHLILCHPLLPPSVFTSIRIFSNESVLHIRWPKYWSFNFSINPSNEYSGLISFKIGWFSARDLKESVGHNLVIELLLLLLSRFSRVRLCATPETAAHQAPPSMGFSRQEH